MKNIDIARLTPETWPARREALVKLFGQEEYGVVPGGLDEQLCLGKGTGEGRAAR